MKELKGFTVFDGVEAQDTWNPVKELKAKLKTERDKKRREWNPVKELKVYVGQTSLFLTRKVESGEGIESPCGQNL